MLTGVHHWIWGWFITQHFCSNSWNIYISWVRKLKSKGLSYFFKTSQRLSSNGRENHVIDSISHRLVPQIFHSTCYSRTDTTSTRGAWNATTPWNWVGLSGCFDTEFRVNELRLADKGWHSFHWLSLLGMHLCNTKLPYNKKAGYPEAIMWERTYGKTTHRERQRGLRSQFQLPGVWIFLAQGTRRGSKRTFRRAPDLRSTTAQGTRKLPSKSCQAEPIQNYEKSQ